MGPQTIVPRAMPARWRRSASRTSYWSGVWIGCCVLSKFSLAARR